MQMEMDTQPPAAEPVSTAEKRSNEAVTEEPSSKRARTDDDQPQAENGSNGQNGGKNGSEASNKEAADAIKSERPKGQAPIKAEYLLPIVPGNSRGDGGEDGDGEEPDDDAAEGRTAAEPSGKIARKGAKGANKDRQFGRSNDTIRLCNSRMLSDEFSPKHCNFGDRCNMSHDLRKYLADGRRGDLDTFGGKCPVWEEHGWCSAGWKCRFVKSHMQEVEREDGRKELVLLRRDGDAEKKSSADGDNDDYSFGTVNIVSGEAKRNLNRKKVDLSRSNQYIQWMDKHNDLIKKMYNPTMNKDDRKAAGEDVQDLKATFVDPPFKPSEKRRIYFGRETPVLAPLTTQGNLPFRRLCVELGAQATYSEMAMSLPIIQGQASEWALMKAHESETASPAYSPSSPIIADYYNNARDLKFGAQISASAPWMATKAAQVLTTFVPHLRLIDLNCGCPIDLVFKAGAGSGLLDQPNKIERMIRGMNAVSGEVPITCKLRIGVREGHPLATRNIQRLAFGGPDFREQLGAPGCAAVTLHGRTRQARYKKPADWGYIAECAALIKSYRGQRDDLADTAREPDASTLPPGETMYFLGNGDCYSHIDYFRDIDESGVDSVMVARGALLKPWIFEEIEKGQYLDKTSTERLTYVEKFCRYGMQAWGADEMGIGTTRRFLLEYLSFAHRYVPLGLLEYLPPSMNDRPPAYKGRDELETLMASDNYRDWIKISEMFLGPAHEGFKFVPKHKSKSYDMEAEG